MPLYEEGGSTSQYEEDHLIPLELGGAPRNPRNLWPEPRAQARQSDPLETTLKRQVCNHTLTLAAARAAILEFQVHARVAGLSSLWYPLRPPQAPLPRSSDARAVAPRGIRPAAGAPPGRGCVSGFVGRPAGAAPGEAAPSGRHRVFGERVRPARVAHDPELATVATLEVGLALASRQPPLKACALSPQARA